MSGSLHRALIAEGLGTATLTATVIGSGVMAERLAGGNGAIALLGNALATGAMLVVLIYMFASVSGAHFNPVVSAVFAARRQLAVALLAPYAAAQLTGGIGGVLVAHAMFDQPLLQIATNVRTGTSLWLAESVATFGLLGAILGTLSVRPEAVPQVVGLYISAAYWCTSSTSFANPALTVARSLTDTFSGLRPLDVPGFVAAQLAGAVAAHFVYCWLYPVSHAGPAAADEPRVTAAGKT